MFINSVLQQIEQALGKKHPKADALIYERIEFICKEINKLRNNKK